MIVLGELINSTRKSVQKALAEKDEATIRRLAREQLEAGADIIDVNTATSMEKEIDDMNWVIGLVYDEVGEDTRIAIDTPNPKAMAAGLKLCKARPLLNSVNNDPRQKELIDIAKGAESDIVGLPMGGKTAMPKTVEERLEETDILVCTLEQAGIDLNRLYIDTIVMTIGSNQEQGRAVIDSTREVKRRFGDKGVKTSVGLSNVSFGLPKRTLLNQAFLAMLLEAGLDMAVIDPRDEGMMNILRASEAIIGTDQNCLKYMRHVRGK
ncbi:MAG: dihydropteroate synthase [Dehalococcoidia bacterium]|nr:MAG: dihydropteroate synthase [Dehalococcoidia bacterium]